MKVRTAARAGLGTVAAMALGACQGSGSFAMLQESLAKIGDRQEQMLARLDAMESKFGQGVAAKPAPSPKARPGRPNPSATYKVTVSADDATKGPATAKVTVVEWSDFQCPFCNRVTPTIEQLQRDYGDDVRVVFKHNPLPMHDRAMAAAQAAEAAGKQGKFWEMHDKLFANGKALTDENFRTWAAELGLDLDRFTADMKDPATARKIQRQQQEGTALGARGTPAFFVNGRFLSGAQPLAAFKALVDHEMKEANALIAAGTPRSRLYEKVIGKGKTNP